MEIVFDPIKREKNLEKHGLDFADLSEDFFLGAMITPAKEGRWLAVNEFGGEIIVAVIFRPLGSEAVSVISMRRANPGKKGQTDDEEMAQVRYQ